MSIDYLSLIKHKQQGQIIFEVTEYAEEKKRNADNKYDELYWQGRADMGRIVLALAFDGLTFGLLSGNNADYLSDDDVELIEAIKMHNHKQSINGAEQ